MYINPCQQRVKLLCREDKSLLFSNPTAKNEEGDVRLYQNPTVYKVVWKGQLQLHPFSYEEVGKALMYHFPTA